MTRNKGRYLAYLLRIWQVTDAGRWIWHASLEDPHTGEVQGFASLDSLIGFLLDQTRNPNPESCLGQTHRR